MNAPHAAGQEGDNAVESLPDSPGRRLRVARQARGLQVGNVADELHLHPDMVESLEKDDYDTLPGPVFVVGYIRKYARVVGLDPEPLLAAYRATAPQREPVRPPTVAVTARQGSGNFVFRLASVALVILLGALTLAWWQGWPPGAEVETITADGAQEAGTTVMDEPGREPLAPVRSGTDPNSTSEASQPTEPGPGVRTAGSERSPAPTVTDQQTTVIAAAEEAVAQNADSAPSTDAEQSAPAQVGSAAVGQGSQTDVTEEEDGGDAETEAAAQATTPEIVMRFDGPCWVDVRDSERKTRLFGEMKKGDRRILEGKPPYSVILGNAAAVQITVGGEPFDLSGKSRGNVARFTLKPDTSP